MELIELQLAKIKTTNADRLPIDFTINGNINIQIDKQFGKLWICCNGTSIVRIRGIDNISIDD